MKLVLESAKAGTKVRTMIKGDTPMSSLPVAVVVAKAPYSVRKNTTNFSDVPLPPEIFFCRNDSKSRVPFAFQLYFLEPFENGKQPEP